MAIISAFQAGDTGSIPVTRSIKMVIDTQTIHNKLIALLDSNKVKYKLFTHKAALTYEDLVDVQKEAGFFGTEAKCMVLKADSKFIVYITLQGKRVNFDSVKEALNVIELNLATSDELDEYFGAQPGCAYPFAFDTKYDIYVDPIIYRQDWLLFSPVFPTGTIQAKGQDLKRVFDSLENKVCEVTTFNQ